MAKSDFKEKVLSTLTFVVLVTIVVGGLCKLYPRWVRRRELCNKNAELQQEIDRKNREINALIEKQNRFKTDADFVEAIARQNQRVYPGDLIFLFEDKKK